MSTSTADVHDPGPVPDHEPEPVPVTYDPDWLLADLRAQTLDHARALANAKAALDDAGRLAWHRQARICALLLADTTTRLDDHLTAGGPLPRAWADPRPPRALSVAELADREVPR